MGKVKKFFKKIGGQIWEFIKSSFPATLMYLCAGASLLVFTMKGDNPYAWDQDKLIWIVICSLVVIAYNCLLAYGEGGQAYEMLVSGNMKRKSALQYGDELRISVHKEVKEYRVWKGFAIGAVCGLFTMIAGIIFGTNTEKVNVVFQEGGSWPKGFGVLVIVLFVLSGWSMLPLFYLNGAGHSISYFMGCAFAVLPILITGIMYVVGAYGKRNKNMRKQALAEQSEREKANKTTKVNYGGLPGTKPKKRK